jgi:hypothetical protein
MNGPAFGFGPDKPEDQVVRRERFEAAHPEIVISAPDYSKGDLRWTARRKDDSARPLSTACDLEDLLDELEWLSAS